jgi:hypothetical protein
VNNGSIHGAISNGQMSGVGSNRSREFEDEDK